MFSNFASVFTAVTGIEHLYILYLEMFCWNTAQVNKMFGLESSFAKLDNAKKLAANQGLYNGFLATGLLWSVAHPNSDSGREIAIFFNSCVAVAALFGALSTGKTRILYMQGSPAFLALAALGLNL